MIRFVYGLTIAFLVLMEAAAQAASQPEPVGSEADLATYVATDRSRYLIGTEVAVSTRTCNETADEIAFWEGCRFELFEVIDATGSVVAASDHRNTGCGGIVFLVRFPPGHCETQTGIWRQTSGPLFNSSVEASSQLPVGDYRIRWQRSPQIDRIAESDVFGLVSALPVPVLDLWGRVLGIALVVTAGRIALRK